MWFQYPSISSCHGPSRVRQHCCWKLIKYSYKFIITVQFKKIILSCFTVQCSHKPCCDRTEKWKLFTLFCPLWVQDVCCIHKMWSSVPCAFRYKYVNTCTHICHTPSIKCSYSMPCAFRCKYVNICVHICNMLYIT